MLTQKQSNLGRTIAYQQSQASPKRRETTARATTHRETAAREIAARETTHRESAARETTC